MAAIEKAINDFFNSGSLKAAAYRANAIFGFSSKVIFSEVKYGSDESATKLSQGCIIIFLGV